MSEPLSPAALVKKIDEYLEEPEGSDQWAYWLLNQSRINLDTLKADKDRRQSRNSALYTAIGFLLDAVVGYIQVGEGDRSAALAQLKQELTEARRAKHGTQLEDSGYLRCGCGALFYDHCLQDDHPTNTPSQVCDKQHHFPLRTTHSARMLDTLG